jgi:hypothetical protein
MISWPTEVVESIARRRAVLFLGAGVSMNSVNAAGRRPPSWKSVLETGIAKCDGSKTEMKRLLREKDFLGCCQIIKHRMNLGWVQFIDEQFLAPMFKSADIHKAILELDSSIVATPNFDKIYDEFATKQTNGLLKIKKFYDDDIPRVLRGGVDQRLILKIHGCIDTPDKLIFTREDYANARHQYHNFYRVLDALFLTHTFIFIGCGMNDPDLSLLLEQYARSFSGTPAHYVLLSGRQSEDYKRLLASNYNLQVLSYSPSENHKELLDSIQDLKMRVSARRDEIGDRRLW